MKKQIARVFTNDGVYKVIAHYDTAPIMYEVTLEVCGADGRYHKTCGWEYDSYLTAMKFIVKQIGVTEG